MVALDQPIVVHGLCKQYGGRNVVDDVDLTVERGEVFGFLGPNGAGKSTTIDILTGRRPRTSGEVSVLDEDPWQESRSWRSRIGVVPQTTGEYPELTTREVVTMFAGLYPDPMPVGEIIELVGLSSKANERAATLSGGQKRRLDVAVGLVGRPELVFLDEPTTGLDPVARREAWELVRLFADRGATTVLTSHYLDEVEALAQRASIIVSGEIVETGTIEELSGRGHAPTAVTFQMPGSLAASPPTLRDHPPIGADQLGRVRIETTDPCGVAYEVLTWARDRGITELPEFRVTQPSLEDVYIGLVHEADQRRAERVDGRSA